MYWCVCLHNVIEPLCPSVDISTQHTLCPSLFLILERYKLCENQTTPQRCYNDPWGGPETGQAAKKRLGMDVFTVILC